MAATTPPKSKSATQSASFVVSGARREAFSILLEVERGTAHCDELLRGPRVSSLPRQDRNLCTTLVMGTLRWQIRLDALIHSQLSRPNARLDLEIRIALRLGAFQLLFLDRIPVHAAIGESVALAKVSGHKFASGMVNAVLRKIAGQPKLQPGVSPGFSAEKLAEETSHPLWIVERWVSFYGIEAANSICLHDQCQPTIAIRLSSPESEVELSAEGIPLEPGLLLTASRHVVSGDITATAAFCTGRVRIQEEGSQLIAELAGHGDRILDCCAAPGGKTIILFERNPNSKIVASEVNPARLEAMKHRFDELANPHITDQIEVRQADATQQTDQGTFDLVLADVPCSGTGTLGRNPEIRYRLKPADLVRHHERQCDILRAALMASSKCVVYSTCSLEPEENEFVVAEVLAQTEGWTQISLAESIRKLQATGHLAASAGEFLLDSLTRDGSLQLLPGKIVTDSFYVAMLERCV